MSNEYYKIIAENVNLFLTKNPKDAEKRAMNYQFFLFANMLADDFVKNDKNFDKEAFLTACGF